MVTIAPERPGALDAIALLASHGVIAALGHTDATYEQTLAGVAAGATVGTHVFNGMRPPHHREPGPVIALLDSPPMVCEFVADGIHLHDGMLAFAARAAGPDRSALVTDAMDAAGMPDGVYGLGGQAVIVADRVARLARDGSIAGSTLTMDAALRRAVGAGDIAAGRVPDGLDHARSRAGPRRPGRRAAGGPAGRPRRPLSRPAGQARHARRCLGLSLPLLFAPSGVVLSRRRSARPCSTLVLSAIVACCLDSRDQPLALSANLSPLALSALMASCSECQF